MTSHRFSTRIAVKTIALCAVGIIVVSVSGCSPDLAPAPSPSPVFASEEEAFAAAEEVYRAYNDALNAIDPAEPRSFEPVFELSSGEFQRADRENLSIMHAEHHVVSGDALVVSFDGESASPTYEEVTAVVCLDVSAVRITDVDGTSLVSIDRPDVYALSLRFVDSGGALKIDSASRIEDPACVS